MNAFIVNLSHFQISHNWSPVADSTAITAADNRYANEGGFFRDEHNFSEMTETSSPSVLRIPVANDQTESTRLSVVSVITRENVPSRSEAEMDIDIDDDSEFDITRSIRNMPTEEQEMYVH